MENMASGSVVAYHPEGHPTTFPRMRSMPAVGSAHKAHVYATPTCSTVGAISEMGPRFRWPIHPSRGTHMKLLYPRLDRLPHEVGGGQAPKRRYGSLDNKIPLRTHMVPIQLSNRANK